MSSVLGSGSGLRSQQRYQRYQRGVSLLEVGTFLGVAALLVGTSMAIYAGAGESGNTDDSLRELNSIRETVASFMSSQGSYRGLDTALLAQNRSMPRRWSDGVNLLNPFKGQVAVDQVNGSAYSVTYTRVPVASCIKLLTTEYGNQLNSLATQNGQQIVVDGAALTPPQARAACNPPGPDGTARITWVFGDPLASGAVVDPAAILASLPPLSPSSTPPAASPGTLSLGGASTGTTAAVGDVAMPAALPPGGSLPASTPTTPSATYTPPQVYTVPASYTPPAAPTPAPTPTASAPSSSPAPAPASGPSSPSVADSVYVTPSNLTPSNSPGDSPVQELSGGESEQVHLMADNSFFAQGSAAIYTGYQNLPAGYGTDWSLYLTWDANGVFDHSASFGTDTYSYYDVSRMDFHVYYLPGPDPSSLVDPSTHSMSLIDNPPAGSVDLLDGTASGSESGFTIDYTDLSSFGAGAGWSLETSMADALTALTPAGGQFFANTTFDPALIDWQIAASNTWATSEAEDDGEGGTWIDTGSIGGDTTVGLVSPGQYGYAAPH